MHWITQLFARIRATNRTVEPTDDDEYPDYPPETPRARLRRAVVRAIYRVLKPSRGPDGPPGIPGPMGLTGRDGTLSLDVKTIQAIKASKGDVFVLTLGSHLNAVQASAVRDMWRDVMPGTRLILLLKGDTLTQVKPTTPDRAKPKTAPRKAAK